MDTREGAETRWIIETKTKRMVDAFSRDLYCIMLQHGLEEEEARVDPMYIPDDQPLPHYNYNY